MRAHVSTSGRGQELNVLTRTRTTKNPTKNFTFCLRQIFGRVFLAERESEGDQRERYPRKEKREMSRQAKNLVSIFSSRISSFSYSQSRSFTAATPPPPPSVFVDKKESRTKMPTISSSSGRNAGGHQEEKPPKAMTTKICIAIRSFEDLVPGNTISGLPADVRKIRLPESRVLYTVLRSPHVDKKSREQFEMRMKKQLLVAKVQSHELRNKYFWLKRQRIFGAQYEIQFHCKTRLDKDKLQKLLL
ncbi:hypothetical protein OIU77_002533 [Salix suchowensis]|uniref:Small ribosomal subunit protein uS10 domain-containing protein n=1 Tax=Salix suchowensis TaxID=1278906 RepID=A0ABQ9AWL0_9ROSI|nr:hypothetical protein OIU77_002533 [Salix suchowensis]KAJ6365983.1 hypothetical protein OIU77_002533 [Salix suchowensis]